MNGPRVIGPWFAITLKTVSFQLGELASDFVLAKLRKSYWGLVGNKGICYMSHSLKLL